MESPPPHHWMTPPDGPAPLIPTLVWGGATDVVPLYEGPLRLHRAGHVSLPRQGRVRILLRSGASVVWDVDLEGVEYEEWRIWQNRGEASDLALSLEAHPEGATKVPVFFTGEGRGIVQGLTPGESSPTATAVRAVTFCLPSLSGAEVVVQRHTDGGWASWSGRHTFAMVGWEVILEAREGLDQLLSHAMRERLYVGTHVVQIRRIDGGLFSGSAADQVLTGLTFGLSFALGRWVGLIHAQGFSAGGEPLWTRWGAPLAETPSRGSTRWWNENRPEDLIAFLQTWMARWLHAEDRQPLSFLVTSALAAGERAFVEQRLLTTMAALDHYWWAFASKRGVRPGPKLDEHDGEAARKIRGLLQATGIPQALTGNGELLEYAREHSLLDTAHALTYIRNRLTHPKATEQLYERHGLVADASRLARRYLDLVLLWELGYQGHACDGTILNRWSGESDPVPWIKRDTEERPPPRVGE